MKTLVVALFVLLITLPAYGLDCKAREQKCICTCEKAVEKCQKKCNEKNDFTWDREACYNTCGSKEDCQNTCKVKRQECEDIKKELEAVAKR
jgi:hypothetical protein